MLLTLHIVVASAWLGLVAAEAVMELAARDRTTREFVARAHEAIDLYFEGPLVILTLLTGCLLLYRIWPDASALLVIKIAAALVAVVSNLLCIRWVVCRARAATDTEYLKWAQKISSTRYAIPFAVAALAIGIYGV